jgi:FkbM family methyltransferase
MRSVIHAELMADLHNRLGIIPNYESILEAGYRRLVGPGDVVLDIGAHAGRHTAAFADLVGPDGHVLAFEPLPEQRSHLQGLKLGRQVTVMAFALSDHSGAAEFVHAKGSPEESGLRQRIYNNPDLVRPERIAVEVMTVDQVASIMGLIRVDFIKIDIEGGEIACLRGAAQTIKRFRPFISVEYGKPAYGPYGHTKQTLMTTATELGYVIGDLFGAVCAGPEEWEQVCDKAFWDYFLIPAERVTEWQKRLNATPHP